MVLLRVTFMNTFVALFRGINVGGRNVLPMAELTNVLQDLGLKNVETYIQSGNVVFQTNFKDTAEINEKLSSAIEKSHGFKAQVLLLKPDELEKAVKSNPFPEAELQPKSLHLFFLTSAPEGIGKSKLAARVEKELGVAATARNWRTVIKILEMVKRK